MTIEGRKFHEFYTYIPENSQVPPPTPRNVSKWELPQKKAELLY
jgi:hypothetical protein